MRPSSAQRWSCGNILPGLSRWFGSNAHLTLTPPGPLSDLVAASVKAETGVEPELSTTGGTSDARFIKAHCPVVEFGLVGKTMHQVDERIETEQIHALKRIYARILADYFA